MKSIPPSSYSIGYKHSETFKFDQFSTVFCIKFSKLLFQDHSFMVSLLFHTMIKQHEPSPSLQAFLLFCLLTQDMHLSSLKHVDQLSRFPCQSPYILNSYSMFYTFSFSPENTPSFSYSFLTDSGLMSICTIEAQPILNLLFVIGLTWVLPQMLFLTLHHYTTTLFQTPSI